MLPAIVTFTLFALLVGGLILLAVARLTGWRLLGAAMAIVALVIFFFLMMPGAYLFRFWLTADQPVTNQPVIGHAVEVLPFADWPHQNGRNTTEIVTAPADGWVLVQYGYEARIPQEVPGCGLALIPPSMTANLTVWDGNAETLRGSADAIYAYAESELLARQANEMRCVAWTVIGLPGYNTPVEAADQP